MLFHWPAHGNVNQDNLMRRHEVSSKFYKPKTLRINYADFAQIFGYVDLMDVYEIPNSTNINHSIDV